MATVERGGLPSILCKTFWPYFLYIMWLLTSAVNTIPSNYAYELFNEQLNEQLNKLSNCRNNPPQEKRWRLYILPQYLANQTKPTGHIERYGLTAVVLILTALLLSSLNDLQFFIVFLYALLEFSYAKHYR